VNELLSFWQCLNTNAGAIGLALAGIPLLWGSWAYITIKNAEKKQRRFETYHRLIKEMVEGDGDKGPYVDRQLAVVYELKNYREYRGASIKILTGFRESVLSQGTEASFDRLLAQIDETIASLK